MSDGGSANQARGLRDHAAFLREAAQCGGAGGRNGLLREAVARLGEARRLDDSLGRLGPSPPRVLGAVA